MSIQVPSELVDMFAGEGSGNMEGSVRAVSFIYFNAESFFPSGLPGEENKWVEENLMNGDLIHCTFLHNKNLIAY